MAKRRIAPYQHSSNWSWNCLDGESELHGKKSVISIKTDCSDNDVDIESEELVIGKPIHLIPKWRPINYSFVFMLISPLCLVSMSKTQKNFEVKMRQRGLINLQTKE